MPRSTGHRSQHGFNASDSGQGHTGAGNAPSFTDKLISWVKTPVDFGEQNVSTQSHSDRRTNPRSYQQSYLPAAELDPQPAQHDYYTKEERYRAERNQARGHIGELEEHISGLRTQLRQQELMLAQTKESAARINFEQADKELIFGPQALDQDVTAPFITLMNHLNNWSKRFASEKDVDLNELSPEFLEDIKEIAPSITKENMGQLFGQRSMRRKLVTAWVGRYLTREVFRSYTEAGLDGTPATDLWIEKDQSNCLKYLEDTLFGADRRAVSHRDLNDWRALTASLLKKIEQGSEVKTNRDEEVEKMCDVILSTVTRWAIGPDMKDLNVNIDPDAMHRMCRDRWSAYVASMRRELKQVIDEAVDLSAFLRAQRANWTVRIPKPVRRPAEAIVQRMQPLPPVSRPAIGRDTSSKKSSKPGDQQFLLAPETYSAETHASELVIDPQTMQGFPPLEDDARTDDKLVQVIFFPALFKRGTLNGDDFDTINCVVKSQVVWSDLNEIAKQPSSMNN